MLENNHITDKGAMYFSKTKWKNLNILILSNNINKINRN